LVVSVSNAYADGIITPKERSKLDAVAGLLDIPPETLCNIEDECKQGHYRERVTSVLQRGSITECDAIELSQLRQNLELNRAAAFDATQPIATQTYVELLRKIVDDGRIDSAELEELERFRKSLGMADQEARVLLQADGPSIYRGLFRRVILDRIITKDELDQMQRFRRALLLTEREANEIIQRVALQFFPRVFLRDYSTGGNWFRRRTETEVDGAVL
jgi:hypothetical protein